MDGCSHLQGRNILHGCEAVRRLPRPWGRAVVGRVRSNDYPDERACTGGRASAHHQPACRSCARRQRPSLGQYPQPRVPLPWQPVVWQDQAGLLHVRGTSAGARGQAGPRKSLLFVRRFRREPDACNGMGMGFAVQPFRLSDEVAQGAFRWPRSIAARAWASQQGSAIGIAISFNRVPPRSSTEDGRSRFQRE
jgi:hypothetical protein